MSTVKKSDQFLVASRLAVLLLAPLVWLVVFSGDDDGTSHQMRCLYVAGLMATFWATGALSLPITSLFPVVLFPLFGIQSTGEVAKNYMTGVTMLFFGGLVVALCVESTGLHKRLALKIILLIGASPRTIMLSFMMATAFLSMWISNTASTAMMLPIVEAVHTSLCRTNPRRYGGNFRGVLFLSIAYSANIGGTAVITGTPPNLLVFKLLPDNSGLNFATWMAFAVPLMLVNVVICWLYLALIAKYWKSHDDPAGEKRDASLTGSEREDAASKEVEDVDQIIRGSYDELGRWKFEEIVVVTVFIALVLLWFFQKPMFIEGWVDNLAATSVLGKAIKVQSATPAIAAVILLFAIPKENPLTCILEGRSIPRLMDWTTVNRHLPWEVVLLIGGGLALSEGFKASHLSLWMVEKMQNLSHLPVWQIGLIVCLVTATITEFMSNTATASVLLPVLIDISVSLCHNPIYLVLSSVIVCSYAFMLPVATAPNAIVQGVAKEDLSAKSMLAIGFPMNLIGVFTTVVAINTYGRLLFDFDTFPDWVSQLDYDDVNCTSLSSK